MEACELLSVELRLDRIDGALARELPDHMRGFARAYARGAAPPPAPASLGRGFTLATARAALSHPVLADRGLALLRLAVPVALEADPRVVAARAAAPSWEALAALAAARDAVARDLFGRGAIALLHQLHGGAGAAAAPSLPPPVAGWLDPDGVALDDAAIARAWDSLAERHGVAGAVRWERADGVRPRAFVVEPGREVVLVIPAQVATPAARFAVLHELGHALAALAAPAGLPRALDEAVAAYVARGMERPGERPWFSAAAGAARARRGALAAVLDQIERALPVIAGERPAERPPWALWHDPGAQAAYVAAESLADELAAAVGGTPAPGVLASALAALRDRLDRGAAAGW